MLYAVSTFYTSLFFFKEVRGEHPDGANSRNQSHEVLIGLLPTHLRPLIMFLYDCGTRIEKALQVEWSQLDLNSRLIHLESEQTKNSEARNLAISSELYDLLNQTEPKTGKVFDGTNLRKEWMMVCAQCGLGTLTEVEDRPYDPIYLGADLARFASECGPQFHTGWEF